MSDEIIWRGERSQSCEETCVVPFGVLFSRSFRVIRPTPARRGNSHCTPLLIHRIVTALPQVAPSANPLHTRRMFHLFTPLVAPCLLLTLALSFYLSLLPRTPAYSLRLTNQMHFVQQ